jgi:hypothetical protein
MTWITLTVIGLVLIGLIVLFGIGCLCKMASQVGAQVDSFLAEIDGIASSDDPYQTGL